MNHRCFYSTSGHVPSTRSKSASKNVWLNAKAESNIPSQENITLYSITQNATK